MTEIEKLMHLIEHWVEHNEEHAKVYLEWASKAEAAGRTDVSAILREVAEGTKKLDELLKKAEKALSL